MNRKKQVSLQCIINDVFESMALNLNRSLQRLPSPHYPCPPLSPTLHLLIHTPRSPRRPLLPPLQTLLISPAPLPRTKNQIHNMLQPLPLLNNRKNSRPPFPHLRRIPLHDTQIRTHRLSQINLVNNQQIRARDTRPTLPGHLITARNVNHVDDEIGQFPRVVRG